MDYHDMLERMDNGNLGNHVVSFQLSDGRPSISYDVYPEEGFVVDTDKAVISQVIPVGQADGYYPEEFDYTSFDYDADTLRFIDSSDRDTSIWSFYKSFDECQEHLPHFLASLSENHVTVKMLKFLAKETPMEIDELMAVIMKR